MVNSSEFQWGPNGELIRISGGGGTSQGGSGTQGGYGSKGGN